MSETFVHNPYAVPEVSYSAVVSVPRSKIAIFRVDAVSPESKSQVTILVEHYLRESYPRYGHEATTVYDVNPDPKSGAFFVVCGLPEFVLDESLCAGLTQYFARYTLLWHAEKAKDQTIKVQDRFAVQQQQLRDFSPSSRMPRITDVHKTKFCVMRLTGHCQFGSRCRFIHPETSMIANIPTPPYVLYRRPSAPQEGQAPPSDASTLGQQHGYVYCDAATPSTTFSPQHHQQHQQRESLPPPIVNHYHTHHYHYYSYAGNSSRPVAF